jgi:siderophore synthetase component
MPSNPSADSFFTPDHRQPDHRQPDHWQPDHWQEAGRRLVTKAIAELGYEELLSPDRVTETDYLLRLGDAVYRFTASRGAFDSWVVESGTVCRDGVPATDPVRLLLDASSVLDLDPVTLSEVVAETTATWAAEARVLAGARPCAELVDLGYAELEQHLPGHPVLVLNKGRVGLDADDLDRYAPEARGELSLVWYAGHRSLADYSGGPGLDQRTLLADELGGHERAAFAAVLAQRTAAPEDYVWFPVHPFQEATVVRGLFAAAVAQGGLVRLGASEVPYRPVQSVRSLVGEGHRDVKTSLLMRNTLVWRGLGATATAGAPAVSAWLGSLIESDEELRGTGIGFMREVASVVVRHPHYAELPEVPYRFQELLGAIWREPVEAHLASGEAARSLAALHHVDRDGRALVAELVDSSGLRAEEWFTRLLDALLPGLLLCLTRHGVAFCPHGENTVVVYRDHVPTRVLVKDFAEDVNLLPGRDYPGLPAQADAVLVRWPLEELAHSIISAIFVGHFRFLAPLMAEHTGLPEERFWGLVREALLAWREAHPDLADAFDELGLLAPYVERVALNREQLTGGGFHDRAERDAEPDLVHGKVANPVAGHGAIA